MIPKTPWTRYSEYPYLLLKIYVSNMCLILFFATLTNETKVKEGVHNEAVQ